MLEEHNEDPALIQMRLLDDGGEELTLVLILYVSAVNIGPFLWVERKTIIYYQSFVLIAPVGTFFSLFVTVYSKI